MNQRLKVILEHMESDRLEGLIVSKGSDIKYLTGFTGEYGTSVLLVTGKACYFVTDNRFTCQAVQETEGLEVLAYGSGSSYFKQIGTLVKENGIKVCGIYGKDLSYADCMDVKNLNPTAEFIEANPYIEEMRAVKTPEEIETIQNACNISVRSFYALLDVIKPGVTEIDIANELEYQFRSRGGFGFCFATIVASGPDNGANCHATASMRRIQQGDFVTIDFGTYYNDYCSDITRTVAIGKAGNPELYKMFEVVKQAKDAGEKSLKPGLAMSELSKIITGFIEANGYKIPHGPGHSFGLDIHEVPFISAENSYQLQAGVIHTIEPGIYIPGVGGVRQEDDYLITDTGYRRLTHITDDLIVL